MKPLAAALALAALLAAPAVRAEPEPDSLSLGPAAGSTGTVAGSTTPFRVEAALGTSLTQAGFSVKPDGSLQHSSGAVFSRRVLADMGLAWDRQGRLLYAKLGEPIPNDKLMPLLSGMLGFSEVARYKPGEVGRQLQAWGVPPSYDNVHLVNPDGTATYFGLMLYHGLLQGNHGRPLDAAAVAQRLSGERLSQSLALFDSGYSQAFGHQRPDFGMGDVRAGLGLLAGPRGEGETALDLRPTGSIGDQLQGYRDALNARASAASDPAERARILQAQQALQTLQAYHYHDRQSLDRLAPPGTVPAPSPMSLLGDPAAPRTRTLPMLLSMLDSLPGAPMTMAQKEAFIKSFPFGETVWRMGAQDLWKQGLQGQGVRVAVIDTGVSQHPELDGVVAARRNFTSAPDPDALGNHATHVAGTIHALAPQAEIRSYAALDADWMGTNDRTRMIGPEVDQAIMRAIDQAVADGNQVINMSLGGPGRPSDAMAAKINEYSRRGVIFVVSAGNNGPRAGQVSSPSAAPEAWTAGALDAQGRVTSFTSFGRNFDPQTGSYVVKPVLLAPGDNINSSVKPFFGTDGAFSYGRMSGTSMAAPHLTGATALMVQAVRNMNSLMNPVEMSRRIQDAYTATGRTVSHREIAPEAPVEQRFIVVDPVAAYQRLRDTTPAAVATPPARRPQAAPAAQGVLTAPLLRVDPSLPTPSPGTPPPPPPPPPGSRQG